MPRPSPYGLMFHHLRDLPIGSAIGHESDAEGEGAVLQTRAGWKLEVSTQPAADGAVDGFFWLLRTPQGDVYGAGGGDLAEAQAFVNEAVATILREPDGPKVRPRVLPARPVTAPPPPPSEAALRKRAMAAHPAGKGALHRARPVAA